FSFRAGRFCSKAIPTSFPPSTGRRRSKTCLSRLHGSRSRSNLHPDMSRVYAIVLRQFYLLRGSPSRIVPYFLWSALDIVLWGFITRFLSNISGGEVAIAATLLGAVILWDF